MHRAIVLIVFDHALALTIVLSMRATRCFGCLEVTKLVVSEVREDRILCRYLLIAKWSVISILRLTDVNVLLWESWNVHA